MNDKDYIIKAENLDYLLSRTVVLNKYWWTGSYKDESEKAHDLDNCTYIDFQWFSESERLYVRKNRYIGIFKTITMKLIELNLQRIIDLCRKHKVKTLAVFGSILTDRFNDQSDVDLLVNFDTTDHEKWDYVTNYFDFRDAL